MKRFLVSWPVLLLAVFVAACGKEKSINDDVSQYFVKCKIGGVDKTFKYQAMCFKTEVSITGETSYSISGKANDDPNNFEGVSVTILSKIPVATGTTYKETDPTDDYHVSALYNPNTQNPDKMFFSREDDGNPLQVKFTEITATTVSGTFSGKLYLLTSTDPNADSAVISNGQFKVKLQQ
jgi:LysM repeat protein